MLKINRIIFIIFVLLTNKDICYSQNGTIKPDFLSIEIPNNVYSNFQNIYFDNKNKLVYKSVIYPKPGIEVLDLNNKKFLKFIHTKFAPAISSILLNNDKSIWIHESFDFKYILINESGVILKEIPENFKNGLEIYNINDPIYLIGDEIFSGGTIIIYDNLKISPKDFKEKGIVKSINTKTGALKEYGRLDTSAQKNYYIGGAKYAMTYNGKEIILLTGFSNKIISFNPKTKVFKPINAQISSVKTMIDTPVNKINTGFKHNTGGEMYKSEYYLKIIYDPYRHLYYLFKKVKMKEHSFNGFDFNIVVLDEKFKNIANFECPKKYNVSSAFISKDGLLIFNKDSYKKDPKHLTFDLFSLK